MISEKLMAILVCPLGKSELRDRVHEVLALVHMDHAATQYPPSISGGMKLRTGLARALVTNPEYVLYDEPNAGLDPIISQQIHELFFRINEQRGTTIVLVTHNLGLAQMMPRFVTLKDGRVEKDERRREGSAPEGGEKSSEASPAA